MSGYVRRGKSTSRGILGERIIVTADAERWIALDGTAVDLWRLLGTCRTVESVVAELSMQFVGDGTDIRRDVLDSLERLRTFDVVVTCEDSSN